MRYWDKDGIIRETNSQPIYNDVTTMPVLDEAPDEYEFPVAILAENGMKRFVLVNARILRQPRLEFQQQITDFVDMITQTNRELSAQSDGQEAALATLNEHQAWIEETVADLQNRSQQASEMNANIQQMLDDLQTADTRLDNMDHDLLSMVQSLQDKDTRLENVDNDIEQMVQALSLANQALTTQSERLTQLQGSQATLLQQLQLAQQQQAELIAALGSRKYPVALGDISVPATALITIQAAKKRITNLACAGAKVGDPLTIIPKSLSVGYGLVDYAKTCTVAGIVDWIDLQCPPLSVGGTAQLFSTSTLRT